MEPVPEPGREFKKTHETKWANQTAYLALLASVNKWYGPISEVGDFIEILKSNIIIDGQRMSKYQSFDDILWMMANGEDVDLDVDGLMMGMLEETITDALIGMMSQAEKEMMLKTFGYGHWVNNMMGSPSTWIRRIQRFYGARQEEVITPQSAFLNEIKGEMETVRREVEKLDRAWEKILNYEDPELGDYY